MIAWPDFGEAIDGQPNNTDSIGHLLNVDFHLDVGSIGKTYLRLIKDILHRTDCRQPNVLESQSLTSIRRSTTGTHREIPVFRFNTSILGSDCS